jgi:hypothetical protein
MIELSLHVRGPETATTQNVTSNHLQIGQIQDQWGTVATGEELTKRTEDFGKPVSQSKCDVSVYVAIFLYGQAEDTKDSPFFSQPYAKVKSCDSDATPKRCVK